MNISLILFLATVVIYIPMAGVLLYVWHKFGQGDGGVQKARIFYLVGSFSIVLFMLFI